MKNKLQFSILASLIALISLANFSLTLAEENTEYRFERLWPRLEQPWYFRFPSDVAIASNDSVYIVDSYNHRIKQFSVQGDFIRSWGSEGSGNGQFILPDGIAIASDGSVYIADSFNNRIQQFSAQGDFIRTWGVMGSGNGQFITPEGIAIASDGSVYVVDRGNDRVQQFSAQGDFIRTWGGAGSAEGQFVSPAGIAIASNDSVYIADRGNNRIQQFNAQGDFIRTWGNAGSDNGQFYNPDGITIASDGSLYVVDPLNNRIQQFSAQGDFIRTWGAAGIDNGQFVTPQGISTAQNGNIYVTDQANRLQRFGAQGDFIQTWGSLGSSYGQFFLPDSIVIASDGSSFITELGGDRVQQFNDQGDFIRTVGSMGSGEGQFIAPAGIGVAPDGSIFIADKGNHRIQKFSAQGDFILTWGKIGDGQFISPDGIAIASDGSVYVSDKLNRIQKFSAQGDFVLTWGGEGSDNGQFNEPKGIAIARNGSVYVADRRNNRIQQFNAQGDFIQAWGTFGSSDGQFNGPTGIVIASDDTVYIVDSGNHRIQQFSAQGDFIRTVGNTGSGNGQFSHPYSIAIASDSSIYITDTFNNRIQKFALKNKATTTHPYKAIILAGGGRTIAGRPNHIWDGTKRVTKKAYKALTHQAFKQHEEIKFLTAGNTQVDLDNNNKFDDLEVASKESLRLAITQWATDATDVVIYLANHGGPGKFQVNDNEILTGAELNTWVTQLEQQIPGKVTVIIEACNSAGFFTQLTKPNRYLFASAKADQPAVISNNGLTSFSYYFWSEVATGAHLKPAFETARQGMSKIIIDKQPQNAQAETDGNQVFNNLDLDKLNDFCLGECNQTASGAPSISPISPNLRTLNGEKAQDFTITVNHLQPLNGVWALVQRPDDISIDPNQPLNFEKIDLSCNQQDVCQGKYERFDVKGEYRISFYVRDINEDVSFPETLTVTQTQGDAVYPVQYDEQQAAVYLRDVIAGGKHYQAALQLRKDRFVLIAASVASAPFGPTAEFNDVTGQLTIPHALAFGQPYQATFKHLGNFEFALESASPK